MSSPNPTPRRLLLAVTLATLVIFGGLVAGISLRVRTSWRDEVVRREAEAIRAVAWMQLDAADVQLAAFGPEFVIDDLFAAVLASSRLHGVLAVQLFDAQGKLRQAKPLAPDDAEATFAAAQPVAGPRARFLADGALEQVSPLIALKASRVQTAPLLEILVPLRREALAPGDLGVARYWLDGAPVAAEFARMDRRLALQAVVAVFGAAVLVGSVLAWAFARLAAANRRLVEQSTDLARANEELDFAAKTGALGAISAHLIHGLQNPLAGLEGFVAETAAGRPNASHGAACRTAVETTQRLRVLVNEVTAVLRDESVGAANYTVPVDEIVEAARTRARPLAERAGVELHVITTEPLQVSARTANLAGLVLANLVANAIEAGSAGATVTIEARRSAEGVEFRVRDSGPGLPEAVRSGLFRPVRSGKPGGGGVGLAISLRLAKHAGGDLQLVHSGQQGTEFRLIVPVAAGA